MTGRPTEGTIIDGRYRVLDRLGSGGMADVYCAEDLQLGRKVALKLLYRRFAENGEFVERFHREASSAAGLQHPNVVGVYDRGEEDGTQYIAMEYLEGRTLKQIVVEEGPLDPGRAIDLVEQVLRAARFAHKRGIIHRDLKPHNVIVDAEDRAKVTDFGIALAGVSDMTETGSIMGTAQYLSPEQAQGQAVDARSDLYSVGIMLYELLTGRVPFDGDSAVTIALKQVSALPVPPSHLNSAISPALERVMMHALAKDPMQRPADADAFVQELEAARSGLGSAYAPEDATALTSTIPPVGMVGVAGTGPVPMTDGVGYFPASGTYGVAPVEPVEPDPKDSRRWVAALIAALVVIALVIGGVLLFGGGSKITVPSVLGADQAQAEITLRGKGFSTDTVERTDKTPKGTIIGQLPGAGTKASKGDTITLTVSSGPGQARVPDVTNMGRRAANRALVDAGFKVTEREEADDTIRKDRVIETTPGPGVPLDKGETVTAVISTGPGDVSVPSVVDQTQEEAQAILRDAELKVKVVEQESAKDEGTVLSQDPAGGTMVTKGDTVTIMVAATPSTKAVPDVTGKSASNAVSDLSGAGFKVVQRSRDVKSADDDGVVVAQNPTAGKKLKPGDTVTITVGSFTAPTPTTPTSTTPTTSTSTTPASP